MKRCLLLSLLCVTLGFFCSPLSPSQAASGPKMFIPQKDHDFKEANEGAVVEHTFTVENRGDEVLQIQKVNPG